MPFKIIHASILCIYCMGVKYLWIARVVPAPIFVPYGGRQM